MPVHVGHAGAVVLYAGFLKFTYEATRELRTGADKLNYVVLVAFRARLRYVHRHALRPADVEMRHYVEYFFHVLAFKSSRKRAQ